MRATVSAIESELERELGALRLAQLKELLVELNRTAVRDFRTSTGQAIVVPEATRA